MNRTELVSDIITTTGAETPEQLSLIGLSLTDIILLLELRYNEEILITDLTALNIADIKKEVIRRYRYG